MSSFSQAHGSVSGGSVFVGLRLGVCQCDGLLDLFCCFLAALVFFEWCGGAWWIVVVRGFYSLYCVLWWRRVEWQRVVDITFQ